MIFEIFQLSLLLMAVESTILLNAEGVPESPLNIITDLFNTPDDKSSSHDHAISHIWSPQRTMPWRSAFKIDQNTILAHKVTHHDLSADKTTTPAAGPLPDLLPTLARAVNVSALISTVQPWLMPNKKIIVKNETITKGSPLPQEGGPKNQMIVSESVDLCPKETKATQAETTTQQTALSDCPPGVHAFGMKSVKCKRAANNPFGGLEPFPDLQPSDTSAERAVRMQKDIQRLMHFVTVVGHVDTFLTKRFRSGLKKIVKLYESEEVAPTQRRRRRISFRR